MSECAMNSPHKTCAMREQHPMRQPRMQHGVVLFIALIALVVMSLAAVALIRSVDTNTIIAGNLAFRQSATTSADSGLESALAWLSTNPAGLDTDSAANAALGYYATTAKSPTVAADIAWNAADSALATGIGIVAGTDASGNNIRYVIQRMCRPGTPPGTPTAANCLFGAPVAGTSSQGVKTATQAGAVITAGDSLMYRVTARVTGPKNTISYIQAFVY